jgi:hypothetical protein
MKAALVVFAVSAVLSVPAFAAGCPDFSGSYQWADEPLAPVMQVKQEGCSKVVEITNDGSDPRQMVIDGVKRLTVDGDIYQYFETYRWNGDTIVMDRETHWKGEGIVTLSSSVLALDENKNLVEVMTYFGENGENLGSSEAVYLRQ